MLQFIQKALVVLIVFMLPLSVLIGQEVKTNADGEKIIVYPDGTWRYFNDPGNADALDGISKRQPTEEELDELSKARAIRFAEQLSTEAVRLKKVYDQVASDREFQEDKLKEMRKQRDSYAPEEIRKVESAVLEARNREDDAEREYRETLLWYGDAEKLVDIKYAKREKLYERLQNEIKAKERQKEKLASTQGQKITKVGMQDLNPEDFAMYNSAEDVMVRPPAPECRFTFDGVDEFTGKVRRDLEKKLLFRHTPDELTTFLKGKDYIICEGSLTSLSGGLIYLSLEFTINASNAPVAFGGLPKGSVLSVKMLDGTSVRLINSLGDGGSYNAYQDNYTYRAQYQISAGSERILQFGEVDMVRVVWGTGYEDYEVFELDFFSDQLKCLQE